MSSQGRGQHFSAGSSSGDRGGQYALFDGPSAPPRQQSAEDPHAEEMKTHEAYYRRQGMSGVRSDSDVSQILHPGLTSLMGHALIAREMDVPGRPGMAPEEKEANFLRATNAVQTKGGHLAVGMHWPMETVPDPRGGPLRDSTGRAVKRLRGGGFAEGDQGTLFGYPDIKGGTSHGDPTRPLHRVVIRPTFLEHHYAVHGTLDNLPPEEIIRHLTTNQSLFLKHDFTTDAAASPGQHLAQGVGTHWTQDMDAAMHGGLTGNLGDTVQIHLLADHPGLEHVSNWDDPRDLPYLHASVQRPHDRHNAWPEVPIRPGATMRVTRIVASVPIQGPDGRPTHDVRTYHGEWHVPA